MVPNGSHARRWGAYVAFGLAALIALGVAWNHLYPRYPSIPSRDGSHAPTHTYQAGGEGCRPDRLRALPADAKAFRERTRCEEAGQEEQRSHEAASEARYASDIAEQVLVVARYQGLIFFWQALATMSAFVAAAFAGWAAYRAFRTAEDTLEHARKSSERELRAYIYADHFIGTFYPDEAPHIEVYIKSGWTNAGKTPAINALCDFNGAFFDGDIPDDFNFPPKDEVNDVVFGMGPGQVLHNPYLTYKIADINALQFESVKKLYLWGWIEYNDVFDGTDRRRTEFCVRVMPGTDAQMRKRGLMFQGHNRHNGMDNGCMKKPTPY